MTWSIWTAGASMQQPRQATFSRVKSRSASVSDPGARPRCWRKASWMASAPFTWQAVPMQTLMRCCPAGRVRNCE